MNIAFLTNHQKTEFFHEIAGRLESKGHHILWLASGHRWANLLLERRVSRSDLCNLAESGELWSKGDGVEESTWREVEELERESGVRVNDLIMMDRLLSLKPRSYAVNYIGCTLKRVRQFLTEKNVKVVFGEATWTYELVTSFVCKSLGIDFYSPQVVRIPDRRFGFFEGHLQAKLRRINERTDEDRFQAESFYRTYVVEKPRPAYWHLNNIMPGFRPAWLWKLVKNVASRSLDRFDESAFSTGWLIRRRLNEVVQARQLQWFRRAETPTQPPSRPYVLYALHLQPESSVDVMGSYFSSQTELIRVLARSLPATHDLYVKEHRNSIGGNALRYYRELGRIPGVRLIDPWADSHEVIAYADLVITITGTVAYEAGLLGKPAITVAPMYFGPLLSINGCNPYDQSFKITMDRLLGSRTGWAGGAVKERAVDFLTGLYADSFEGNISDPRSDPTCMDEMNLDRVAEGFQGLLNVLARQAEPRPEVRNF